ncbi:hypothetical protein FAZ69_13330 [Trinickia terrae]|uniref:Uncharacterized protein n=1 Tax=Trinickia terrae TaxID=2571161 RepID=A0A4U1I5U4_9BURK|nr:hypothetical protein [Trinickia terrae]TKC88729.1 hypothetical protein FAZ69_13330 [Trinickia terrae]
MHVVQAPEAPQEPGFFQLAVHVKKDFKENRVMAETGARIVGDKTNNYVVFDPQSGVVYTLDLKANLYGQPRSDLPASASAKTSASQPASAGITGNAATGVVYFSGQSVSYLTDIDNSLATWKPLPDAPFAIKGICGDLLNGIVIHDGDNIAQIKDVFNNPVWQESAISPRIPIAGIAGDATNGIVVYRESQWDDKAKYDSEDNKFVPSVYLFTGQPYGSPTSPLEPKIAIEAIMGDGVNGYIAMGENQLFSLIKGAWAKMASLKFGLACAIGNPKDGVVALIGGERYVATSADGKTWNLVNTLPAAASSSSSANASGNSASGAKTAPGNAPAPAPAAPAPTPTPPVAQETQAA